MIKYFHFTLGPVQSFVGQARRTRDFWAGSFLLSWLSGVAMQSVKAQGGKIVFPLADEDFLKAMVGDSGMNLPRQGSIPNRFKAEVDENFQPQKVVQDVRKVWQTLADIIYEKEVALLAKTDTKKIWDRQVECFWDINWVLVEDKENASGLDRRKNWRSQYLPEELGIKCSLMGDWQELSGVVGVREEDRKQRENFWGQFVRKWKSDFSEKEHLCAISYIKRRFLDNFVDFSCDISGGKTIYGWKLLKAVPSVAYIAAAPWFAKVLQKDENSEDFKAFFEAGRSLESLSEYDTEIFCVEKASKNNKHKGLDGNLFYEFVLDNSNIFPDKEKAGQVKNVLKKLTKKYGAVSPFYAVLIMDGDNLGSQMSEEGKQKEITEGLKNFINKVPEIVYENNGFLIYAGGDDVLALITLEDAFNCALKLRKHYEACFKTAKDAQKIKTSISAGIIYTHINTPLKNVLHEAHELLDEVAKERAGRDAVAVRVYKGSGLAAEWAKQWDEALTEDKNAFKLNKIQNEFQLSATDKIDKENTNEAASFSSKFFYRIRHRFEMLYGKEAAGNSAEEKELEELGVDLLAVDYMQSSEKKLTMEEARKIIEPLMAQSENAAKSKRKTVDAALLVRFLAQKGIEGGRS